MKASKFTKAQIAIVLKQAEDSVAVAKVSRQLYGRQHSFVPTSSARCDLSKMDCTSADFTDADLRGVRTANSICIGAWFDSLSERADPNPAQDQSA